MCWLTVKYQPGLAWDLTYWTTQIDRDDRLVQTVLNFPSGQRTEARTSLSAAQVDELERLIAEVDFVSLADPVQRRSVIDDAEEITISVKDQGRVLEFSAPLLSWEFQRARRHLHGLPLVDFAPALRLWEAVERMAPRRLESR